MRIVSYTCHARSTASISPITAAAGFRVSATATGILAGPTPLLYPPPDGTAQHSMLGENRNGMLLAYRACNTNCVPATRMRATIASRQLGAPDDVGCNGIEYIGVASRACLLDRVVENAIVRGMFSRAPSGIRGLFTGGAAGGEVPQAPAHARLQHDDAPFDDGIMHAKFTMEQGFRPVDLPDLLASRGSFLAHASSAAPFLVAASLFTMSLYEGALYHPYPIMTVVLAVAFVRRRCRFRRRGR